MVQKNRTNRPVRSRHKVVEFDFGEPPKVEVAKSKTKRITKSYIPGVKWIPARKAWRVKFKRDGNDIRLGEFSSKQSAESLAREFVLQSPSMTKGRNKSQYHPTSKYKGVYWDYGRWKWRVSIRTSKDKIRHVKYFDDEKDAARGWDIAAVKTFGDGVLTNKQMFSGLG